MRGVTRMTDEVQAPQFRTRPGGSRRLPATQLRLATLGRAAGPGVCSALLVRPLRTLVVDDCRDLADSTAEPVGLWEHDARRAYARCPVLVAHPVSLQNPEFRCRRSSFLAGRGSITKLRKELCSGTRKSPKFRCRGCRCGRFRQEFPDTASRKLLTAPPAMVGIIPGPTRPCSVIPLRSAQGRRGYKRGV
jgi:hypothetical protein